MQGGSKFSVSYQSSSPSNIHYGVLRRSISMNATKRCTSNSEILQANSKLNHPVTKRLSCSRLVLRRLSTMLGVDPGPINGDTATVEHILPRRPGRGTGWDQDFTSKAMIDEHVHRLGNLAVLSFGDNQKAGSSSFETKRPIFAASGMALAEDVSKTGHWTPETIHQRSAQLAGDMFAEWDLKLIES